MATYLIANMQITDPDRYPVYASQVQQTIERHGGRYLARGGKVEVLEGHWKPQRLVILEFESMERLREWYDSPGYAPLKQLREEVAVSQLVVEGL